MDAAVDAQDRAAEHAAYLDRKAKRDAKSAEEAAAAKNTKGKAAAISNQRRPVVGQGNKTAARKGTKGLNVSGFTTVEPTPTKPAQRVMSNVILRIDMDGLLTKER